ncbi:L-serine ammonia-lyase [Streptomonospora salina]|uniref:L-serine dehydratase n=1 Tax=Streptomonospora salina TaxID=104205 RepID=A0A841EE01_9ACTN|nr:L-serine ammonia-lyase [Streptomonospora salina]MBB5999569.1 L-serine dehydratase [Streptomonospora salina]
MAISVFDLFTIGIGPSSSHTVGPMRAARRFADGLDASGLVEHTAAVRVELYGSLALTGKGHGSDRAVVLGLLGRTPEDVDIDAAPALVADVRSRHRLALGGGRHEAVFDPDTDLEFRRTETLPGHPNGMRFVAADSGGGEFRAHTYYSVGGGFVVDDEAVGADRITADDTDQPYPFASAAELLQICRETGMSISAVMLANERAFGRSDAAIREGLLEIWRAMRACVRRGVTTEGTLPGGLKVTRRAPRLYRQLGGHCEAAGLSGPDHSDPGDPMRGTDWITLYALAVNEENAAGGRVVTAPTNGAAGIIPAVLHYYAHFTPGADDEGAVRFLLAAGAVGILYKHNASISGAEVGCQGEVGSASSMAAAGLAEAWGATPAQIENAAEIAMEHNLGLTCDPIGGLVQVPCIERNALASIKAISAARIAVRGDGSHFVSLDKAIQTMRDTGRDMMDKYKETSRGGLAVNVIEC